MPIRMVFVHGMPMVLGMAASNEALILGSCIEFDAVGLITA